MITKIVVIVILVLIASAGFMWLAERFHMFDLATSNEPTTIDVVVPESNNQIIERPKQIQEQIQQFNAESTEQEPAETPITDNQETSSASLLINEEESQVNAAVVADPANTGNLKLVFNEESWTEVTDSEGRRYVYRLVEEGAEIHVDGIPPYTVLLGNAEGVEVFHNGELFNHKRYQRDQIAYFRLGKKEE